MRVCSVEGCGKKHESHGYCKMHSARWRKHGDPGKAEMINNRRGEGCIRPDGYHIVTANGKPLMIHRAVAEKALGKPLPNGVEIHHVNENRSDNRPENLVICQDKAYHKLLHQRQSALDACGNANWRKCCYCGQYQEPNNSMYVDSGRAWHKSCANERFIINKLKRIEHRSIQS